MQPDAAVSPSAGMDALSGKPGPSGRARCCLGRVGALAGPVLGLSVIAVIWIASFYFIAHEKREMQDLAFKSAANLASAFEEQLIRTVRSVDQTLLYVRDRYADNRGNSDISSWTGNAELLKSANFSVAIVDSNGRMVALDAPGTSFAPDLSDRDYFRVHDTTDVDTLYIGQPLLNRFHQNWSVQFSRRIVLPDGSFGGVAVVSVMSRQLADFYRSIDLGEGGVVALVGTDGVVRAAVKDRGGLVGKSLSQSKLFTQLSKADLGAFEDEGSLDGVDRFMAYRKVRGYPLVIAVGLSREAMLDEVAEISRDLIVGALIISLGLLVITFLLWRYQRALARARDDAEAGTRARTEFLAMMSHEIRTPMNGVVGMSEVLMDTDLSPQQMAYARTLRDSASYLLGLIDDVLDFAKLESGNFGLNEAGFDVGDAVRSSVAALAPTAIGKGLTLDVSIAPDVPSRIVSDPARLRQVLFNLIGNGLKFTERGGVAVSVKRDAEQMLPGFVGLSFAVTDTGIGIPADGLPLLFKEFSQLDRSIARRFGGTGLGLAICRRLVTLMGGSIRAESVVGQGTTMRFTIVGRLEAAAQPAAAPGIDHSEAGAISPDLKILLAEDNQTNQQVFLAMINRFGLSADIANDGAEAVAACAERRYDVVFMDVMMPGMDGLVATRAIRKMKAPLCDVPIVALTANAQAADREKCLKAGMNDFLAKPVTRAALIEKLRPLAARAAAAPASAAGTDRINTMKDEAPVFDRKTYGELLNAIDPIGMSSVLRTFLTATPDRLSLMRRAAREGDGRTVRLEAHAIKSSAASIGFLALAQVAQALEKDGPNLPAEALASRTADLAKAFVGIEVLGRAELGALAEMQPEAAGELHVG